MKTCIAVFVGMLALGGWLAVGSADAQTRYSTACRTNRGVCPISPAPLNSACRCYNDPGRVFDPPPAWHNVCQTRTGRCPSPPYPVGTACRCGNIPGQIP